ncbi:MAG: transcriptional regulator, partial [Bacteroidetes bacterium]|nr:transcriptional regulator [Bacteroidota bacterium]
TVNYDFDARQTDYYVNAAKYLGLVTTQVLNDQTVCVLTESGRKLFELSLRERQLEFIRLITRHEVFNKVLKKTLKKGSIPGKSEIVGLMKTCNLYRVGSDETFRRRASTVYAWINWILAQIEE